MRAKRKLFFPAGLLSLTVLPLLIFNFLYQAQLQIDSQRYIEAIYWDSKDPLQKKFSPYRFVNEKFTKIRLTGNGDDKIKLDFLHIAVRELMIQTDTTQGIEVTLGKGTKYSSFIRLWDICEIEKVRAHLHHEDKFWIFNLPPRIRPTTYEPLYENKPASGSDKSHPTLSLPAFLKNPQSMIYLSVVFFILLVGMGTWKLLQLRDEASS